MLLTTSFLFVASAQNGLTSMIGQEHAMSGQISAVWNIFLSVPTLVAFLIGGHHDTLTAFAVEPSALRTPDTPRPPSEPVDFEILEILAGLPEER